ncbi:MAG: PAS domain S-box protein [Bacteroidetes bacterium]|nr:PAS domain S-box protein [Bacteroidota bacterium]
MKKNKYPKIQSRLIIASILLIFIFGFINVTYYIDVVRLNEVTGKIIEHPFIVSNSVRDIEIYINTIHRSMKDVTLSTNDIEFKESIAKVDEYEELIYQKFELVNKKFLGDLKIVNEAYTEFVNWKPIRDKVIDLVESGNVNDAAKITKGKGNNYIILLLQKTHKMIDFANDKAESFNQNSIDILQKSKKNFFIFFIVSFVISIILFLWIYQSISYPINNMINRIKNVSGDKMKGFPKNTNNQLSVLDFAISEFENRKKILEENINIRTKELKEARNLIVNAIDNAPIGIVEVGLDGKFNEVNMAFCDIVGYSTKELDEMTFTELTVEEDKNIGKEFMENAIKGKELKTKFEKRYIHKSGGIVFTSVSSLLVKDENNKPLHFFTQISDISEQKKYELELTTHKNELENKIFMRTAELDEKALNLSRSRQALTFLLEDVNEIKKQLEISNSKLLDSNKELESFSYSVSHDLKAPLRAVIGFSQILNEDFAPQLNQESKRYIGLIKDNAENMGTLINDLLNFSRMGRTVLQKSQIDLPAIVQRVKNELQAGVKDQKISFKVNPLPMINADEKLIYHVMLNLISNAVKFTDNVKNAIVEIGCTSKKNENVFYVKDNGIGFDMKYAGKIFDVFQRLHTVEEFPGTGIGLSIVQRIIHKHEGKIWVESEKNKGTTFFFTI